MIDKVLKIFKNKLLSYLEKENMIIFLICEQKNIIIILLFKLQLMRIKKLKMAEKGGFEPPRPVTGLLAFQASPFNHLGISP